MLQARRRDLADEPSAIELHILTLCACAVLAAAIQLGDRTRVFWEFGAGDTLSYTLITEAIRTGNVGALREVRWFWGLGYVAAAVARLTRMSDLAAVLLVSMCSALISAFLARRLWGGWIAAFFIVTSWDWLVASTLGGSETLFVALVLGAFLAARHQRWTLAALLASCSMTVRPVGLLALLAVVATLAWQRHWRSALTASLAGLTVVAAYTAPILLTRGDAFAYVWSYQRDWIGGFPIGWPFAALVQGMLAATMPIQIIRPAVWVVIILAGSVAFAARKSVRSYPAIHPVEAAFAALYFAFLFSYNAARWAWLEFPRFAIPLIPFALVALDPLLPKRRPVLWIAAPVSGLLAAVWLLGFHTVWYAMRSRL